jgi:hypothetical protein
MKDIQNKEELGKLIDLYKQSKITKVSIEVELTKAINEVVGNDIVQLKIVETVEPDTNSTFGVVSHPEKIADKMLVTVLVDKDALLNMVSSSELIDMVMSEVKSHQKTLKAFSKFLKGKEENEISMSDALIFFMELYRDSLKRLSEELPEIYNRLRSARTIQSPELIESEIKLLEVNSDIHNVSERLTVSRKMPKAYLHSAMELAKVSGNTLTDVTKVPLFYKDDEPVMNQFYQQRRALSDGTYDMSKGRSKQVAHDYYPKTNQ